MTVNTHDLTIRPITGPEELELFNRLPYVLIHQIADDLAEGTRILAGEGVDRILAATDEGNTPMAAAFGRAGYATISGVVNMSWA